MEQAPRLDRWLWAARLFRTRSLAVEAITGGWVGVEGGRAKPSRRVKVGEQLEVTRGRESLTIVVRGLSERRGPATEAAELYEETPESIARREQARAAARQAPAPAAGGRPTKRDRRRLDRTRSSRRR